MNVFVDKHHESLFDSLVMLFEKRLGWKLYTQAGMDWYKEGLWNVYPHPSTAEQYLLREVEKDHGITREQFKQMDFDLILCSIPQHIEPFMKLAQEKNTNICFQVGNMWAFDTSFPIKNILASAKMPLLEGFNQIEYHQNFDLDVFYCGLPKKGKKIYSFINCLNTEELYRKDWELFLELEKLMPDWEFKSFGGQCRDGAIWDRQELADKMREATFIYQCKTNGDGYGHTIHSAAAVGRPLIVRESDYKGKLAEPLIHNGVALTSIMVAGLLPEQIAEMIYRTYDSGYNLEMGEHIYEAFKNNVDFDKEQKQIEVFLANLI